MTGKFTLNRIQEFNTDGIKCLSIMLSDLAALYYVKQEYENALKYFSEYLEYLDVLLNQECNLNVDKNEGQIQKLLEQINYAKVRLTEISLILGMRKINKGDFLGAKEIYEQAISYDAKNSDISYNLARCLKKLGAFHSAYAFAQNAFDLNPSNYDCCKLMGDINFHSLKNITKAIEYYEEYLTNVKDDANAYNTLGCFYMRLSMFENLDKQLECFEKAVALNDKFVVALRNLTLVYPRVGRVQDAITCYEKLFKLEQNKKDEFYYGCLHLKNKNFVDGFKHYEARFYLENNDYPKFKKPKWNGKPNLNKIILVQSEQGFGDSIMFARYLAQLSSMFKKVIFRVQDELVELFKSSIPEVNVIPASSCVDSYNFDFHVPLLSLPKYLNADISSIPFAEGYISPDSERVASYKKQYFDNDYFKIGIAWHGSTTGARYRNVPVESFVKLEKLKNVKIYSLQKDENVQINDYFKNSEVIDLGNKFENFSDTAAAIANLDLVISSDNCVLNLAASMGKDTYLLLPKNSEWRWFDDNEKTPWYKSVRIFRGDSQDKCWDELMEKIFEHLSKDNKNLL